MDGGNHIAGVWAGRRHGTPGILHSCGSCLEKYINIAVDGRRTRNLVISFTPVEVSQKNIAENLLREYPIQNRLGNFPRELLPAVAR